MEYAVKDAVQCYGKRELAERLAERKELRIAEEDGNAFVTEPFAELEVTEEIMNWLWKGCAPAEHRGMTRGYLFRLRAKLEVTEKGIWIRPDFQGKLRCVKCGELVEAKLWKALFEFYPDEHPMLNELVLEHFAIWVPWEELGEPGLVSMENLFHKFSGGKEALRKLARSDENPFNHSPLAPVYVAKDSQPVVLERWRNQLKEFQESLRLN